ncbi:putative ABC transporter permease subunit [Salibacterium sp. K-3]
MIRILLQVQWKIWKHTIETNRTGTNLAYGFTGLALAGFLLLALNIVTSLPETYALNWLDLIFSYLFMMMLGLLLLMGVPQVFKHLYASGDLAFLFTLPIKVRHIYWVKYIQSFIGIPAVLFLFTFLPGLFYGFQVGAHWYFYPALLVVLLSIPALGVAFAYFINMGLVHIIPAKRANELMTVMSAVSGLLVYAMIQLPNLMMDRETESGFQAGMLPEIPGWLPMSWGASALTDAMEGNVSFLLPMLLLAAAAAGLSLAASTLVEKGFRSGWIQLNEGKNKKKTAGAKGGTFKVRRPVTEIGLKEWRYMKRDVREWLIFMPFVFLFIFFGVGSSTSGAGISGLRELDPLISWTAVQAVALAVFAFINGSLSASFVAREGVSSWMLQVLPVTGIQTACGKLWMSWLLPYLPVSFIQIAAGLFLDWPFHLFLFGLLLNAVISPALSAMGLWIGAVGGKYNPANPQNRVQTAPSILMMVSSYVYVLLTLIPVLLVVVPAESAGLFEQVAGGGIIGGSASVAASLLQLKLANGALVMALSILVFLFLTAGTCVTFLYLAGRRIEQGIQVSMPEGRE